MFAKAKKVILNRSTLNSDFELICNWQEMCNQRLEMSYQLSEKVYSLVMIKVRNARFGEVLANYSKKNQLKIKESLESKQNSQQWPMEYL